jgi:hypothetical protein
MDDCAFEDVREEICTLLAIGHENGEPELETITRLILLERQRNVCLSLALAALQAEAAAALERERTAAARKHNVLEWKVASSREKTDIAWDRQTE